MSDNNCILCELNKKLKSQVEDLATREGYDRWAKIYDQEDNALIALEELHFSELLGEVSNLEIADLGCGTGRLAVRLVKNNAKVTAIDFSAGMVEMARQKPEWSKVNFIRADLSQPLPFLENSFDRVLSCLVLDHISNLGNFFSECRRICKPNGFVLASIFHPAMMLLGVQARFTDPQSGASVRPASCANQISDYVSAVVQSGMHLELISEKFVDEKTIKRSAKAARYKGWPLLLLIKCTP